MMKRILRYICFLILISCSRHDDFDVPAFLCVDNQLVANISFGDLKGFLKDDQPMKINEDLILEGYIISSDKAGNFFGTLHIQDKDSNATSGFQIEIDMRNSYLFYDVGKKIYVKLKGLYLDESNGVYKIGGLFRNAGGTLSVGRLPVMKVHEHILAACEAPKKLESNQTFEAELNDTMLNTLVSFSDFQVIEEELSEPFAVKEEETKRTFKNCDGQTLVIRNSGYSDFRDEILPDGSGIITGVLTKYRNTYELIIRDLSDINFGNPYIDCYANDIYVFMSEIADPDNDTSARFVELYNASDTDINFNGWQLERFTNDHDEVSSKEDLTGYTIHAKSTFVIAADSVAFENIYGFSPDLNAGSNSPANSNGDDNLRLVNSRGDIIDVFGVVGEDGSGTNHEFEDGRALREPNVLKGNPVYDFNEWIIFNDTGEAGTTNLPQQAPEDFSPGLR